MAAFYVEILLNFLDSNCTQAYSLYRIDRLFDRGRFVREWPQLFTILLRMVIKCTMDNREKLSIQFIGDILSYRFHMRYLYLQRVLYTQIIAHITSMCHYILERGEQAIFYFIESHIILKLNVR